MLAIDTDTVSVLEMEMGIVMGEMRNRTICTIIFGDIISRMVQDYKVCIYMS